MEGALGQRMGRRRELLVKAVADRDHAPHVKSRIDHFFQLRIGPCNLVQTIMDCDLPSGATRPAMTFDGAGQPPVLFKRLDCEPHKVSSVLGSTLR